RRARDLARRRRARRRPPPARRPTLDACLRGAGMRTSPSAVTRVGLVLVATGILSFISVRGYLDEDAATAIDLTFGFGAFFALVLLASGRTPPRWASAFALTLTGIAYLWGTTLVGGQDWAAAGILAVMGLAYYVAQPAY